MHITAKLIGFTLFLFISFSAQCQHAKILKGASEFRRIIFDEYMVNLQQVEKIRLRLDSLGFADNDFYRFANNLNFVAKNIYSSESASRQYRINALKTSKIYYNIDAIELEIIVDNIHLISVSKFGIWKERYPHRLDNASLRLKEIAQYGIKEGDHILHYSAGINRLSEILYLSYDSLHISYHPYSFTVEGNKIFNLVASSGQNPSSILEYSLEKFPKPPVGNQLYDKIIYDCVGMLFYTVFPDFKKKMKNIHKLLAPDGEFIASMNYQTPFFDGPVPDISTIDEKIERILKCGFELKEKIHSENEYLVYKFRKVKK